MLCPLRFCSVVDFKARDQSNFECVKDKCAWFVMEQVQFVEDLEAVQIGSCAIANLVPNKGVPMECVNR